MKKRANNTEEKHSWDQIMNLISTPRLKLGEYFSYQLLNNTRHLLYTLSRYKFAAKTLVREPPPAVLELGCSEGIGTLILSEQSQSLTAVDSYKPFITWAKNHLRRKDIQFIADDFLGKMYGQFDAVVALDVIEHIKVADTRLFISTICNNLQPNGFCIVGTPNKTARKYASPASRKGHVNLFSSDRLRKVFLRYFENVFLFGMNDEVVHTGFEPMCHYFFALACTPKRRIK